jgi:hypothetical protein
MNNSENSKTSWWHTVPGILTGIAAVITGITGLLGLLYQLSLFDGRSNKVESNVHTIETTQNNITPSVTPSPSDPPKSKKMAEDFLDLVPSIWTGEIYGKIFGRTMLHQTFRHPIKMVFDPSRTTENRVSFYLQSTNSSDSRKDSSGLIQLVSETYSRSCFSVKAEKAKFSATLPSESYSSIYCDSEKFFAKVTKRHEPEEFAFEEVTLTMAIQGDELKGSLKRNCT